MKRLMVLAALSGLGLLGACGGSDSPSAPTPPTTTLPPSFSGTYRGTMTFTGGGFNAAPIQASTTVTHTGTTLALSDMTITSPFSGSFGLGSAVLNGNSFDGTNSYSSGGCGIVTSRYVGHFAGNLMNLTVTLTPAVRSRDCFVIDIRGELSR
ncbi:MAG TPA: hypothetical protein VFM88_10470 [Vicinamibacteria bacterium]|nr:hypothetical protein [Vicinamibacteria bacterium]